jgi:hypothetical protein
MSIESSHAAPAFGKGRCSCHTVSSSVHLAIGPKLFEYHSVGSAKITERVLTVRTGRKEDSSPRLVGQLRSNEDYLIFLITINV